MSISKLPNELLQSIFTYYTLSSSPSHTLLHVCRRWFALAHETVLLKSRIIYLSQLYSRSPHIYPEFLAKCASPSQTVEAIDRLRGGWFEFTYNSLRMESSELALAPLPTEYSSNLDPWRVFSRQCTKLHLHLHFDKVRWLHHFPFFYALTHLEIVNAFKGVITAMLARVNLDKGCPLVSLKVVGEKSAEILEFARVLGGLKRLHVETDSRRFLVPLDKLLPLMGALQDWTWVSPPVPDVNIREAMTTLASQDLLPNLGTLEAPGQLVAQLPPSVLNRITHLELRGQPICHGGGQISPISLPQLVHLTLSGLWKDMFFVDTPRLHELVLKDGMSDQFYDNTYTVTPLRPTVLRMPNLRSIYILLLFIEPTGTDPAAPFDCVEELYVTFTSSRHVEEALGAALGYGRLAARPALPRLKHLVTIPPAKREDLSERWRSKWVKAAKQRAELGIKTLETIRCA